MFFMTTVINSVSTIVSESSDVFSATATDYFSNYQDYVEVDYSKTNNNERSYVQDPIKKCYDGNYIELIITEAVSFPGDRKAY